MSAAGTDSAKATSTAISVPHGSMNTCGTKPSTLTIAAAAGPYAKPAIRHTMPDGSYLRNENAGFAGSGTR